MTEAQPRSLYASRGFYTVKKPIAHILTNTKNRDHIQGDKFRFTLKLIHVQHQTINNL